MKREKMSDLDMFFYPRSVAIIGASADPKKAGNALGEKLFGLWV